MLAFHLRREGLVVMLMSSPDEALDAIAWAAPDVLLVELTGRGFDGTTFLRNMGELPVDVFAVVDRPLDAEAELEALRYGVVDVLTKPLDAQALSRRLRSRPERARRGSMPGLPEGGISGDLAVHSAMYVLQLCHRHRLNARLHVEIQGDWAVLLVRHGEVIDAEAPSATGREAAYQAIRAAAGSFVLVPLLPDAEELSRDDVVRADLATLVGDALGRREPRSVNATRLRGSDTFVLPNVGSPRAPQPSKKAGDETLEYQPRSEQRMRSDLARVKRPGETKPRSEPGDEPARITTAIGERPRSPTRPMPVAGLSEVPEVQVELLADEARETIDEGFDEPTDQRERREHELIVPPPRALARSADPTAPRPTDLLAPSGLAGRGLRRTTGRVSAQSVQTEALDPAMVQTAVQSRRVQAPTDRHRARVASTTSPGVVRKLPALPRLDGLVVVLSIAAFALAIFVVWRVLANAEHPSTPASASTVAPLPDDNEVRFGAALAELEAGHLDVAEGQLAELAAGPAAPDGALAALARLYFRQGKLMEAESVLTRMTTIGRADARVWAWLGLVRAQRQDLDGARGAFAKARAEKPDAALDAKLEALEHLAAPK